MGTALRLDAVTKRYGPVTALDGVSLSIPRGTFTAVMGRSGSGKSTLLQCAAGLDRPSSGAVHLGADGTDLARMSEKTLTLVRRRQIGFVFQAFNLVPALTVRHNVTLPLRLAHRRVARAEVDATLDRVGLAHRAGSLPAQLSGGQQQRVAIARALITRPDVIFADEPTGALDTETARDVLMLLRQTVDDSGQTVVMVTHDPVAATYADSIVFLAAGRVVEHASAMPVDAIAHRLMRDR